MMRDGREGGRGRAKSGLGRGKGRGGRKRFSLWGMMRIVEACFNMMRETVQGILFKATSNF